MLNREAFYGVIGLGKTGWSCASFLKEQKIAFEMLDTREEPAELKKFQNQFRKIPVHCGELTFEKLSRYDILVVSPGISIQQPLFRKLAAQGHLIIGDIELFALMANAPVIGITGSNAKGTVTTLLGLMAEKSGYDVRVGGNIGTPALDILSPKAPDLYVLEISSFQLETTYSLSTKASVILNFCEDHLDRYHGKMSEYIQAKQRIYLGCEHPIYNRNDVRTMPQRFSNRPMISFGLNEPGAGDYGIRQKNGEYWLVRGAEYLISTKEMLLRGQHHWANALAALALGHCVGLPISAMTEVLRTFQGLPHRCQWVGRFKGLDWYNDSKATNVGAALAALEGLGRSMPAEQKIILIAGGQGKGADFSPLREPVRRYVRHIVLLGQDAALLAQALEGCAPIQCVHTLSQAVEYAAQGAHPNDIVLFAPACASLDMFRNYEDRGEQFCALLQEYAHCESISK